MMNLFKKVLLTATVSCILFTACKVPALVQSPQPKAAPSTFGSNADTTNTGALKWRNFFADKYLVKLIDTALVNNQELFITLQEIEVARNEIRMRKGMLLPTVTAGGGAGIEKVGRYTSQGAGDESTEITPGQVVPEWLPDFQLGLFANWEIDAWKKLRTAKKAAITRYLATVEGRNFVITNLIAEVANSYYELLALDNQMEIVKQTILLQQNALEIVRVQKQAAAATELAVKKFEAEVLNSQSREFDIRQMITAKENSLNFLLGRYPQPVARDTSGVLQLVPKQVATGIPSQLLQNRPDIKQAELELAAAKLDVTAARAEFYPSFNISAGIGLQAFSPKYIYKLPESVLFSLAGDVAGPLINRNAIKAEYSTANAKQIQAVYNYERSILNAYVEVSTELSNIKNREQIYNLKSKEVNTLSASIEIANALFRSSRADYLEVLLTQRDALESKLELIETRLQQLNSVTNIYRALGGGWK